jgi:PAS domain S-box-containing protein
MPLKIFYHWFSWLTNRRRITFVVLMTCVLASLSLLGAAILHSHLAGVQRREAFLALVSLEQLLSSLVDAETGQRGYLLTEKAEYLEPYHVARRQLYDRIVAVRRYRPFPSVAIDRLESGCYAKIAELEETVRMAQAGRRADAINVLHTDHGKRIMDEIRRMIATLRTGEEIRVRHAERSLLLSSNTEIVGFMIVASFTTLLVTALIVAYRREERARVEAEFSHTQAAERYRAITEAAPGAIIAVDSSLMIDQWNRMAANTFGWDEGEIIGKAATMLVPERFREQYRRTLLGDSQPDPTRRTIPIELFGLRKDGTEFPAEVFSDFFIIDGVLHAILIFRDITPRRHMEQQQARLQEELERSNNELQKFAYVASHDLQEPLRVIGKLASMLAERYAHFIDEPGKRYIVLMCDAVSRMQNLISDLLTYSRIAARAQSFERVNLTDLVRDVIADLSDLVTREGGSVCVTTPLPIVEGESFQLRQLFQNLISNGLKFHRPAVSPTVTVAMENCKEADHWQFAISDNGIGIDPSQVGKLFQIFMRLHAREDYEGTGIGLAVCQKIVERHGGRIWIESEPGKGSIFRFTLAKGHQNAG